MRKLLLVPALLCVMAGATGAQTRISGRLSCAKPSVNDTAGDGAQMIMFSRANCTWSGAYVIDGNRPKRTVDAGIGDISGSTARVHGYTTNVMDNGDSIIVRYEGRSQFKEDGSGTDSGTWKYVRGTGEFKGITGSGTFRGVPSTGGGWWADLTGNYSLPKSKAKKAIRR